MAVVTSKRMDLMAKNAEKLPKPTPNLLPNAPLSSEAKVTSERMLISHQDSRSAFSRASASRLEEVGGTVQEEDAEEAADGPELSEAALPSSMPLAKLDLEACPSFGEQNYKPLWLDRHATLQRVYSDAWGKGDVVEEHCLERLVEGKDNKGAYIDDLFKYKRYLPGWEIVKSQLWLMTEAALGKAQFQAHTGADPSCAGLASVAEKSNSTTHTTTTTSDATASGSGAGPSTPFGAALKEAHAAAVTGPCQPLASPPTLLAGHTDPPLPPVPPAFQRLGTALHCARSMGRAALATPLGLGNALAPCPTAFEAGRTACVASRGAATAAAADGLTELKSHGGRHHFAFAAGLAAATSAAAAVSQAATVAASGLAAVASLGSAASSALELGGKALSAGGGVLVDRVQGLAARHAASAVAELILGPYTSTAAREMLVSRVQATVAGASVAWFVFNLLSMSDTLAHLDFEHDFATSAKVVLDLATSGPSLMENCKELMQIGVAISLRMAQRSAGGGTGGLATVPTTFEG